MFKKDTEKLLAEIKDDSDMKKFLTKNRNEFVEPLHVFFLPTFAGKKFK